jgi:ADP-ribose pyrophosphatase YjhB (NUDIX family)
VKQVETGVDVDDGLPVRSSRVGAYAIVVHDGRVLLTQLAPDTPAPGVWTLPGGGLDHGEAPLDAVVREVLEETDHRLVDPRLVDVDSVHFVGRAPGGRLEDFHGLSVIYRADVEHAHEPRVLDVGGSTAAAAWVPLDRLDELDLGRRVAVLLARQHLAG